MKRKQVRPNKMLIPVRPSAELGDIEIVLPGRYKILNSMRIGTQTVSSKAAITAGVTKRKALDCLNVLQQEGYVTSINAHIKFPKSKKVCLARVFTKVKDFEGIINTNWD